MVFIMVFKVFKKTSEIKLLVFVPALFSFTGDAINERQLIAAITKIVRYVYCITFVKFKDIARKNLKEEFFPEIGNIKIIPLPLFSSPLVVKAFLSFIYSILVTLFAIFLEKSRVINVIYVRHTWLGFIFSLLKPLIRSILILKIPSLIEHEINALENILHIKRYAPYKKLFRLLEFYIIRNFDFIKVASPLWEKYLQEKYRLKLENVGVCPAGVNLNKIEKIKHEEDTCRGSFDGKKIGFIGVLAYWQGIDILLQAFKIVLKKNPNAKLYIIGGGPQENELRALVYKYNLHKNVFLMGRMPHLKTLKFLKSFDMLVVPSRHTIETDFNVPIKIIEAWSLGVPVIVTKHKIFSMLCKNYEDVVFCEPEPYSIATAIIDLLSNDKLRLKLIEHGYKLASMFDYDKIALDFLSKVCGQKNSYSPSQFRVESS